MEEFVVAVKKRYGETCLIQFEDFANANAFRLLEKYQKKACTFNDDIQGTASVALSGLITAVKMTGIQMKDARFLFYGAGEAAIGTANLIVLALVQKGLSEEEAKANIWLVDSKGLIVKDRPGKSLPYKIFQKKYYLLISNFTFINIAGGINHEKAPFAKVAEPLKTLSEAIEFVKPTALIGCAAQGRQFTKEIIERMSTLNKNPIIFALSNPTSKAECKLKIFSSF